MENKDVKFIPAGQTNPVVEPTPQPPPVDKPKPQIPTEADVRLVINSNNLSTQFKNSLKFVQGGTNMSLERMVFALDRVLVDIYLEGYQHGLAKAKEVYNS